LTNSAQREAKRFRKDPHQRCTHLSHVRRDASIIRAALATLEALLEHSNEVSTTCRGAPRPLLNSRSFDRIYVRTYDGFAIFPPY